MKKKRGQGQKSDKWDQVPIGEEFLSDKEFENLISLEVLNDYQIVRKSTPVAAGKRKADSDDDDELPFDDDELPQKKKPQKKKAKQQLETKSAAGKQQFETKSAKAKQQFETKSAKAKQQFETKSPTSKQQFETRPAKAKLLTTNSPVVSSASTWSTSPWTIVEEKSKNSSENNTKKNKLIKKQIAAFERSRFDEDETVEETDYDVSYEEWVKLGVPETVLFALKELKFQRPTPIQSLTLPAAIMGKKDIVGAAETGSGKTLAFAIPMIRGILNDRMDEEKEDEMNLKALILTPTRELASQIKDHIDAVAKHSNINVMIIVGGLSSQKQERLLRGNPDIIVATPGRLWELTKEGNDYLSGLCRIKYLAVDETDRMVEKGHFQELEGILNFLNSDKDVCGRRQNFVFSATLSFTHEPPQRLHRGSIKKTVKQPKKVSPKEKLSQIMEMIGVRVNAKIVDITSEKGTADSLTEMQISCQLSQKDYYLHYFLTQHPGKTIVFSNSINCVRRLTNLFFHLKFEALPLHSEMHQKLRLRNLERFSANSKGILICTDVAARGLDIKDIQFLIHYQVPKTAESYIHRSGRTARVSKDGLAVLLIEPAETTTFWNIFRSLNREDMLPPFQINNSVLRELKTQVDLANDIEKFEHMIRKKYADMTWTDKAKREMDLASSEEDSDEDEPGGKKLFRKNMEQAKKSLEVSKKKLAAILSSKATSQANT